VRVAEGGSQALRYVTSSEDTKRSDKLLHRPLIPARRAGQESNAFSRNIMGRLLFNNKTKNVPDRHAPPFK